MKKIIILIILISLFLSCKNNTENKKVESPQIHTESKNSKNQSEPEIIIPDSLKRKFKILKIDSISDVYITYAFKSEKYYKILSKKSDLIKSKWKRIELGAYYDLKLKENYSQRGILEHVTGIAEGDGPIIYFEGDSIRSLYSSTNIKGLYYTTTM